jgi:hypothetical protein
MSVQRLNSGTAKQKDRPKAVSLSLMKIATRLRAPFPADHAAPSQPWRAFYLQHHSLDL